jgi:hypothetical protein
VQLVSYFAIYISFIGMSTAEAPTGSTGVPLEVMGEGLPDLTEGVVVLAGDVVARLAE